MPDLARAQEDVGVFGEAIGHPLAAGSGQRWRWRRSSP